MKEVKAKIKIPDSKDPIGYTKEEIIKICELYEVDHKLFSEMLGVVTGIINEETEEFLIFKEDVINTLNKIIYGRYLFFD